MVAIKFITKSGEQIEKMVFKIEESQANTPPDWKYSMLSWGGWQYLRRL